MEEVKIGDEILVKAKVLEIRILKEGKIYKAQVESKYSYSNEFLVEPACIIVE